MLIVSRFLGQRRRLGVVALASLLVWTCETRLRLSTFDPKMRHVGLYCWDYLFFCEFYELLAVPAVPQLVHHARYELQRKWVLTCNQFSTVCTDSY